MIGRGGEHLTKTCQRVVMAPEQHQHIAAVEMHLGEIRLERDHPFVAGERVVVAPEIVQQRAAVAPGLDRLRVDLQRAVVARDRLCPPAQFGKRIAAIALGVVAIVIAAVAMRLS